MRHRRGIGGQGFFRGSLSGLLAELLESRTLLAAVAWDGGGDGSSWSDPRNWSADVLPGLGDDVSIAAGYGAVRVGAGVPELGSLDARSPLDIYGGGLSAIGRIAIGASSRITAATELHSRSGLVEVNADLDIGDAALVLRGDMVGLTSAIRGQSGSSVSALGRTLDLGGLVRAGLIHIEAVSGGQTYVHGVLNADDFAGGTGGTIRILGGAVTVDGATISASGASGGGQINVGGSRTGDGPLPNARVTGVSSTSSVRADSTQNGDGGEIIVWADEATGFYGTASARGGPGGGNGGFVETSAAWLDVVGASVDVGAPAGSAGEWLLDPWNITISADPTQGGTFQSGVFTPSTFGANIQASAISSALSGGTNVVINTEGVGPEQGDVDVNAIINKTGPLQATLTIIANNDIRVNSTIAGTTFPLGVNLNAGGTISVVAPIQTSGGDIAMVGSVVRVFTAISSVGGGLGAITIQSTLAEVEILAAVNAGTAEVTIQAEGNLTLGSTITGDLVTLLGASVAQGITGAGITAVQLAVVSSIGGIELESAENQFQFASFESATWILANTAGNLTLLGGEKPNAVEAGQWAQITSNLGSVTVLDDVLVADDFTVTATGNIQVGAFVTIRSGNGLFLTSTAQSVNLLQSGIIFESDDINLRAGSEGSVLTSSQLTLRSSSNTSASPAQVTVVQGADFLLPADFISPLSFAGTTDGVSMTYESRVGSIAITDPALFAGADLELRVFFGSVSVDSGAPLLVRSLNLSNADATLSSDVVAQTFVAFRELSVMGSVNIASSSVSIDTTADGVSINEDSLRIVADEIVFGGDVGEARAFLSLHATASVSIQLPGSIRAGGVIIDGAAQAAAGPGTQIVVQDDVVVVTPVVSFSELQPGELLIEANNISVAAIGDVNFGSVELIALGFISLGASITAREAELTAFEIVLSSDLAIQLTGSVGDFTFDGAVQSDGTARSIVATLPGVGSVIFSQPVGSFNALRSIIILGQPNQSAVLFRSNVTLTDEIIVQGRVSFDVGVSFTASTFDFRSDVLGLDGGSVELLPTGGVVAIGGDVGSPLNPMASVSIAGELLFGGTRVDAQNFAVSGLMRLENSTVLDISADVMLAGGVRGSGGKPSPSFTLTAAPDSNVVLGPVGTDDPDFELESVTLSGSLNPITLIGPGAGVRANDVFVLDGSLSSAEDVLFAARSINTPIFDIATTASTVTVRVDAWEVAASNVQISGFAPAIQFLPRNIGAEMALSESAGPGVVRFAPSSLASVSGVSIVFGSEFTEWSGIRIDTNETFAARLEFVGVVGSSVITLESAGLRALGGSERGISMSATQIILRGDVSTDGPLNLFGQTLIDAGAVRVESIGTGTEVLISGPVSAATPGVGTLTFAAPASGRVVIDGSIGLSAALGEIVFESGTTTLENSVLRAVQTVVFNAPVKTNGDITIEADNVQIRSSVDSDELAGVLSINVGTTLTFLGNIGGNGALANVAVNGGGSLITGASPVVVRTLLSQTYNVPVSTVNRLTLTSLGSGGVRVGPLSGVDVIISTGGDAELNADVSLSSLAVTSPFTIIRGAVVTATSALAFSGDVSAEAVTATFSAAAMSFAGGIIFGGTALTFVAADLSWSGALTLVSGALPTITFEADPLATGIVVVDFNAGTALGLSPALLQSLGAQVPTIRLGGAAYSGSITIDQTLSLASALVLRASGPGGDIYINQPLRAASLDIAGSGGTTFIDADIVTSGPIVINDAVNMQSGRRLDTTDDGLNPQGADIAINGSVTAGSESISLVFIAGAGILTLGGSVGTLSAPFENVGVTAGGIRLAGDVNANAEVVLNGPVTLLATVSVTGNSIVLVAGVSGAFGFSAFGFNSVNVAAAISVGGSLTLSAGSSGQIQINSGLQSGGDLTLLGGDSTQIIVNSSVSSAQVLTVTAPDGTLRIDSSIIEAAWGVSISARVLIAGDVTIAVTLNSESSISINGSIDSAGLGSASLSFPSGQRTIVALSGDVGLINPLTSLDVDFPLVTEVRTGVIRVTGTLATGAVRIYEDLAVTAGRIEGGEYVSTGGAWNLLLDFSQASSVGTYQGFGAITSVGLGAIEVPEILIQADGDITWAGDLTSTANGSVVIASGGGAINLLGRITKFGLGGLSFSAPGAITLHQPILSGTFAGIGVMFDGGGTARLLSNQPFQNALIVQFEGPAEFIPADIDAPLVLNEGGYTFRGIAQFRQTIELNAANMFFESGVLFDDVDAITITGVSFEGGFSAVGAVTLNLAQVRLLTGTITTTQTRPSLLIGAEAPELDFGGAGGVSALGLSSEVLSDINSGFSTLHVLAERVRVVSPQTLSLPLRLQGFQGVELNAPLLVAAGENLGQLAIEAPEVLLNAAVATGGRAITLTGDTVIGALSISVDATNAGGTPAGANIRFLGSIRGTGAGQTALSVNAGESGSIEVTGDIGATTALSGLSLTSETGIELGTGVTSIVTTGGQTYFGPVAALGNISFDATSIFFSSTLEAVSGDVVIVTSAGVTFDEGGTFGSLDVSGPARLTGLFETAGVQGWYGPIEIAGGVTLRSTGAQVLVFDVSGLAEAEDRDLAIEAAGEVELAGEILGLTSLQVSSSDVVIFSGSLIEAEFGIQFLSSLRVPTTEGGSEIVSLSGAVAFSDVSIGADNLLDIRANEIDLTGAFTTEPGGGVRVRFETVDPGVNVNLGAGLAGESTLDFTANELAQLNGDFESVTFGSATGSGAIRILGTLSVNFPVILSSPAVGGSFVVSQDIRMVGGGSISFLGSGATLFLNADIVTQGTPILIADSIILGANVTLDTTDGGVFAGGADITVTGTINSSNSNQFSLTLVAGFGTISLQSEVGGADALSSLTSDALNTEVSDGVRTTGNQVYNSAVVLLSDSTFEGANLAFNSAIGGEGFAIVLNSPGLVSISGGVQAASLLTDAGGQTEFSGLLINSSGDVIFNDPFIVIVGPTTIIGGTGTIRFNASVAAGGSGFTLTADEIDIFGAFSGSGDLVLQPFTLSRDINIAGPSLEDASELDLPDDELGNIQDGFNSVTYGGSGGSGAMDVNGGAYSDPTVFQMDGAGGTIRINARVSGTGNGGITIRGSNSTTEIFADIVTDGTPIRILDSVIIAAPDITIDSTNEGVFEGAEVLIDGRVDSEPLMSHDLTLKAGDADIRLNGEVGGQIDGELGSLETDAGGRTLISGGLVRTLGSQTYNDRAEIASNAELNAYTWTVFIKDGFSSSTFDVAITADEFELDGPATGTGNLWIRQFTLSRDVNINLGLESATSLDIENDETSSIDSGGFSSVTYGNQGGNGVFVINGYEATRPTNFVNNGVGGRTLVQSGITGTGNGGIGIRGSNSTTEFFADVVTDGAPISILDSVIIRKPTLVISSTGNGALGAPVFVTGFINSETAMGYSLSLDSGDADATLGGPVGGAIGGVLGSLDVETDAGTINIDGGLVSTIGTQSYNADVRLGADLLVRTVGAPVTFDDDVNGAGLIVDTGTGPVTVNGDVGTSENPLDAIVISDGTDRRFEGVVFVNDLILTDGTVQFLSGATIKRSGIVAAGLLTGVGDVTFQGTLQWTGGTINGDGLLVLDTLSLTTIEGPGVKSLSRDLVVGGRAVWTEGNIEIDGISITILEGGTFELLVPYSFIEVGQGNEVFNSGLFVKGGGGITIIEFPFNNLGEIRIDSGELHLLGGGNHASLFNLAQPGTRLVLDGGHSGGEYDGVGTVSLLEPIARISVIGGVNFEFAPGSYTVGSLRNAGDLLIPVGVQLRVERSGTARSVENHGVLELDPGAGIVLTGGFVNAADATLRIFVAGSGLGQFGFVQAGASALLNGSLIVEAAEGYVPMRFVNLRLVAAAGGVQGTFQTQTFPVSGEDSLISRIIYDADAVRYLTTVRSDLTLDGRIDLGDFLAFFNAFDYPPKPEADVDGNGVVDFADFCYFFNEYDVYLE